MASGAFFPNVPQSVTVYRLKPESTPTKYIGDPFRPEEKDALDNNRAWYSLHGHLRYRDVFGEWHQTQFCMADPRKRPDTQVSTACSDYNQVDW